jgi:hypothetical protein
MFQPESARFSGRGAAEQGRLDREAERARKEGVIEAHRAANARREEERHGRMQAERAREEAYWAARRGTQRSKTASGAEYDIFSLGFKDGREAERQRYAEESARHSATARTAMLFKRNNNTDGVNPITGEPLRSIEVTPRPTPPT